MYRQIYLQPQMMPVIPAVLLDQNAYDQMLRADIAKTNALYIARQENEGLKAAYQNIIKQLQVEIHARNYDINKRNEDGSYLIHQACFEGNLENIQFLVANGAQTNVVDSNFMTPLHVFSSIQNGIHLHPSSNHASQVIDCLTQQYSYDQNSLITYLNQSGGSLGFSALHCAVANNHRNIVGKLLSIGANPALTDNQGRNAFHLALTISNEEEKQRMIELVMHYFPIPEPITEPITRISNVDVAVQNIAFATNEETQTITEHSEQNIQTDLSLYHLQGMEMAREAVELKVQQLTESLEKAERDKKQQDQIVLELQEKLLKSEQELEKSKLKVSQQNKKLSQQESLLTQTKNQVEKIEESSALAEGRIANLELLNQNLVKERDQLKLQIEQSSSEKEMTSLRLDLQKSLIINFTSQGSFGVAQHLIENDPKPSELFTAKTDINKGSLNLLQICASIQPDAKHKNATDFIFHILPENEIVRQSRELNSYGLRVADICCNVGGNIALLKKLLEKEVIDPNVKSSVHDQAHRSLLEIAVTNKSLMNLEAAAAFIEFGADIKQTSPAHSIKFNRAGTIADLIKVNNDNKIPEIIADAVRKSVTKKLGLLSTTKSSVTKPEAGNVKQHHQTIRYF